jgi:hypothetical protein
MKTNKELIKKLANGEIAVKNDGTLEELRQVIIEAFPKDKANETFIGLLSYYFKNLKSSNEWTGGKTTKFRPYSVKDFFIKELPEKWCIKYSEEVGNFFNQKANTNCYINASFQKGFLHRYNITNEDILKGTNQGRSFYEAYIRKGYTEITIEQFREITNTNVMKKEIKGYKLMFAEYYKTVSKLLYNHYNGSTFIMTCIKQPKQIEILKEAGVLDLWFEPVYNDITYKIGDIVYIFGTNSDGARRFNKTFAKIIEIDKLDDKPYVVTNHNDNGIYFTDIRHATPEEIEEYNKPKLPIINGYAGKIEGNLIIYGNDCAKIPIEFFEAKVGNRYIKSMTLNSNVTIDEEQIDAIRKVLKIKT